MMNFFSFFFSEYKRIKKVVFKRQVEKAYEILCSNDQFIKTIEQKMDEYDNVFKFFLLLNLSKNLISF